MPVDYGLLEAEKRATRVSSMKGSLIVGHFTSYRGVDILTKFLKPLFQYLKPSVFLHTVDLKMRHLPCKKEIKSSRQPTNQIKIEVTKVRSPNTSTKMCISCHEPVTPDDEQYYECICGTAPTTVKEADGLVIDVEHYYRCAFTDAGV